MIHLSIFCNQNPIENEQTEEQTEGQTEEKIEKPVDDKAEEKTSQIMAFMLLFDSFWLNPIDFVKDYDKISLTILLIIIGGNMENKKDKKNEIKFSSAHPMIRQMFQDYDINNIDDLENALKDVLEKNIEEMKALGIGDTLFPESQNDK